MTEKLKYLTEDLVSDLYKNVEENLDLYKHGDFLDLARNSGWGSELKSVTMNIELLAGLEGNTGAEAEVRNSMLVHKALEGMTPNLAREERIWTRLTHVECFEYSRKRWISEGADDSEIERSIKVHFFADTANRIRDDNAVSRLWWNAHIAHMTCPSDPLSALELVLSKADIRSNFIERPWVTSRANVAGGIIRAMKNDSWISEKEVNYREFMKTVNKYGGGILFEIMNEGKVDQFMTQCSRKARNEISS